MLRHVLILARDSSGVGTLTIALDRHLSRGEQVEIVEDRRQASGEVGTPRWPVARERRRATPLTELLTEQGYAMISREDDAPVQPPRPIERPAAARGEPAARAAAPAAAPTEPAARAAAPAAARAWRVAPPDPVMREEPVRRPRQLRRPSQQELLDDWAADLEERDRDRASYRYADEEDFDRPRRRGGLVTVLLVGAALAVGFYFVWPQAHERLAGALGDAPPPRAETATPAVVDPPPNRIEQRGRSAMEASGPTPGAGGLTPSARVPTPSAGVAVPEEPARTASNAPDRSPTAPLPESPAATGSSPALPPAPAMPSARTSSAATREPAPAAPAARASSASASLPPRRVEAPPPDRLPDLAPRSVRSQRLPEFPGVPRVEVSRAPSPEGTTFTVRLTDTRGQPLADALVSLRQRSTDGFIRETQLDPVSPAGSYRGAVAGGTRRDELTVRVLLGDKRIEMPLTD